MRKASVFAGLLLASCVAPPQPSPPTAPPPPPAPPPRAVPAPEDWRDIPLTPGGWAYLKDPRGSSALFGRAGMESDFLVRCDVTARTVTLSWPGPMPAAGNSATITTSGGVQSFSTTAMTGTSAAARTGLTLPATSPFLDKLAFSRGRFVVTQKVGPRLVIPAWPEPARAIEDCRK